MLLVRLIFDDFLKHFSVILYPLSGNRMIMALRRLHLEICAGLSLISIVKSAEVQG